MPPLGVGARARVLGLRSVSHHLSVISCVLALFTESTCVPRSLHRVHMCYSLSSQSLLNGQRDPGGVGGQRGAEIGPLWSTAVPASLHGDVDDMPRSRRSRRHAWWSQGGQDAAAGGLELEEGRSLDTCSAPSEAVSTLDSVSLQG